MLEVSEYIEFAEEIGRSYSRPRVGSFPHDYLYRAFELYLVNGYRKTEIEDDYISLDNNSTSRGQNQRSNHLFSRTLIAAGDMDSNRGALKEVDDKIVKLIINYLCDCYVDGVYPNNVDPAFFDGKSNKRLGKSKTVMAERGYSEGSRATRIRNEIVRSPRLRKAAIEHYSNVDGSIECCVCGFDFGKTFGEEAKGYIHIHHENQLAHNIPTNTEVKDLKPVCPNCHVFIHMKRDDCKTIKEVKEVISKYKKAH